MMYWTYGKCEGREYGGKRELFCFVFENAPSSPPKLQ